MNRYSAVGRAEPRTEATAKATGQAIYTADRALQNLAWGRVVRSSLPHARIAAIDTAAARKLPGVLAVVTARDVSDQPFGRQLRDMPLLAIDRVRFIGEKVAAVAAEAPDIAEEAAGLVEVKYEELPAVFDAVRAMQEGAPVLHEELANYPRAPRPVPVIPNVHSDVKWQLGNCARGFAEADAVFEQVFTTQRIHQGYLEPHACVVHHDAQGRIVLWASNKVPFQTRQYLAEVLGIDPAKILFQLSPVGGDFGGKGSLMDIPLAYYLSRAAGRPVKMIMSYGEELAAGNPRHPALIRIKSGVKADGTLSARQVTMIFNSGAYAAFKPNATINLPGARHAAGAYRIPHASVQAFSVYTNTVPSGHMRGPGDPQVYFAVESHTDYIARKLNIDPVEFRRRNVLRNGDILPAGERVDTDMGEEILKRIGPGAGKRARRGRILRGKGIGLCLRDIGPGEANVEVGLSRSGKVYILTTVTDTGAGAHTMLRQVVAEAMGARIDDVEVNCGDTDSFETDIALGGSRVTFLAGKAATLAAEDLRGRIAAAAAAKWQCPAAAITISGGGVAGPGGKKISFADLARVGADEGNPLKARGHFATRERKGTLSYFAQLAEVEVDAETGRLAVRKITSLNDAGTIINPLHHQGQVEGGIIQGLGFTVSEELPDADGKIVAAHLGDYKIPNIRDIPRLDTVNVDDGAGPGPFRSKPIGENTGTPTAAAIANAVYDAIGIQITDLPITAEKIYHALRRAEGE